jgi:hypothetical protein
MEIMVAILYLVALQPLVVAVAQATLLKLVIAVVLVVADIMADLAEQPHPGKEVLAEQPA